jgi:sirohydrochlorin cobaltochelatase
VPHAHPAPRDPLIVNLLGDAPTAKPSAAAGGFKGSDPPVIGLAHGSRQPGSGAAIERLMTVVGAQLGVPARAAFLDLAEPTLPAVAAELAESGHRRAVVVPLLFTAAFHATVDTPEAISAAGEATGLELVLAPIIGTGNDLEDVLDAHLATVPEATSLLLVAVGSSNAPANAEVQDLARRLGLRRGVRAAAAFATCDPRPEAVSAQLPDPSVIVPLFLADGLLLRPLPALAAARGWDLLEPLGERAAPIVTERYRAVVAGQATDDPAVSGTG